MAGTSVAVMLGMPTRRFVTPLAHIALLSSLMAVAAPARAADDEVPQPLKQEYVGLEAHVLSLAQGNGVNPRPGLGLGGMLRFGRHRWSHGYITPFELGGFVGGADGDIISFRALTEGGAVIRGDLGVLEVGLGVGAGLLSIAHGDNHCDGSCLIGGKGVLLSPVVRYLFRETTRYPVGVVLRGEVPLFEPSGSAWGYYTGWGSQVLLGFDVGVGSSGAKSAWSR
jgi:hypothetical protein